MFATMRQKRRSTKMKSELGQGVVHFKRAAALAAQETGATVGPKWNAARDRVQPAVSQAKGAASTGWGSAIATLAPLVTAAADQVRLSGKETKKASKADRKQAAKKARKLQKRADKAVGRKRSRGGKLFTLALAGAALGAGAAYAAKRRQAAQWDEYDPSAPISPTSTGADDAAYEPTGSTAALDPTVVPSTGTTSTTGTASSTDVDPTVVTGTTDQTASHQHSPKVARMAGGQNTTQD